MNNIYPENFEVKIGFNQIRSRLKEICLCELGKERVEQIKFTHKQGKLEWELELTSEFTKLLQDYNSFPTSYYFDMRSPLVEIKTEGRWIEPDKLFDLKRSLDTIIAIFYFIENLNDERFSKLKQLSSQFENFSFISKYIDIILDSSGKIKDSASPELAEIRRDLFQKQSNVSKRLHAILKHAQLEGIIDNDTTISIRDGRPVIPIPSANKRQLRGIVHDESATGKTSYIEPTEVVELNNQIRELEYAEKREIIKILIAFANKIRAYIDGIISNYDFLGTIDFVRAKAILANKMDAIKPSIKWESHLEWYNAVHPLLSEKLKKESRQIVPLNIKLTPENHILLISGPNAGGKSVCLKTVGLLQYMLQCGLLIPVLEASSAGIFENIFIDIGDEQSIDNDLSTYSSHLLNMKYFLRNANNSTLVLIDEFGTGTEPMLGGAIAEAILSQLNNINSYGIITTHYTNLKHFASSENGIINGAMLYDTHKLEPQFKLEIGKPGSSFAFEIARKIGMPEAVLKDATDKIGKDHIDFDKNLRQILRDKHYWESKRQRIRKVEKSLDDTSSKYEENLQKLNDQRKLIIDTAKAEATKIISEANKKVENTIREIRENQASKEQTKNLRKSLNNYVNEVIENTSENDEWINKKIEKIRNKKDKKTKNTNNINELPNGKTSVEKHEFCIGDKVRILGQETIGEIIDIGTKNVVVALGLIRTTIAKNKLIPISNNEAKREVKQYNSTSANISRKLHEKRMNFKSEIDIRGQRVEEALSNIQSFVDEAIMVGVVQIRILHGKGNGVLKETIRNILKTDPAVKSFRDEHVDFGGSGITIVDIE